MQEQDKGRMEAMEECTIENPVRFIDLLSTMKHNKFGNTPRPEKAELLFISAIQLIDQLKWELAEQKLIQSLAEAKRSRNTEGSAISAFTLGWVQLHLAGAGDRAIGNYTESLALWEGLHSPTSKKLVPLLEDIARVCQRYGKNSEAERFATRAKNLRAA